MSRYFEVLTRRILPFLIIIAVILTTGGCTGLGTQHTSWSGVVLDNGKLFFGSNEGKLVALDAESGNSLWQVSIEISSSGGFGCAAQSTAVAIYSLMSFWAH